MKIKITLFFAALLLSAWSFWFFFVRSEYRKALPSSATHVHESSVDMFPDFTLFLKARLPKADFETYARSLGLGPLTSEASESVWLAWENDPFSPSWWDPSPDNPGSFGGQDGDIAIIMKHEKGNLYLVNWSH